MRLANFCVGPLRGLRDRLLLLARRLADLLEDPLGRGPAPFLLHQRDLLHFGPDAKPLLLPDGAERRDTVRIELGPSHPLHLDQRGVMRLRFAVGPVAGDRVVRVGHREQPRTEHDLIALEPRRITTAVVPLLMLQHDHARIAEELDALQERPTEPRVLAHLVPLLLIQRSGLEQHRIAHADLADVVQQGAHLDGAQLVPVPDAQLLRDPAREPRNAPRMPLRLRVPVVEHRDHSVEQVGGALLHQALEALVEGGQLRVLRLYDRGQLPVLLPQRVGVERLAHGTEQLDAVPGLGEDAEDLAVVHRVDGGAEVVRGGEQDADGLGLQGLGLREELRAGHARHHVVGGEYLERLLAKPVERLGRIGAGDHLVARGLEGALQCMQDGRLIVDDEEAFDLRHFAPAQVPRNSLPAPGGVTLVSPATAGKCKMRTCHTSPSWWTRDGCRCTPTPGSSTSAGPQKALPPAGATRRATFLVPPSSTSTATSRAAAARAGIRSRRKSSSPRCSPGSESDPTRTRWSTTREARRSRRGSGSCFAPSDTRRSRSSMAASAPGWRRGCR